MNWLIFGLLLALITCDMITQSESAPRRRKQSKKSTTEKPESDLYKKSELCPDATNDWGIPYRYHKPSKKCHLVGEKGPCADKMEFTMLDDNYGYCDCDQSLRCGRPLIYWPDTKQCYFVNDQGPCSAGKWLVFGFNHDPVCKKNGCESKMKSSASRGQNFWFEKAGKCYKTGSRGDCKGEERLVNKWNDYRPSCSEDELECGGSGFVHKMECLPGMKMDYYDSCMEELAKNRTRVAAQLELEAKRLKKPEIQFYPLESFPEDDYVPSVYQLAA